MTPNERERIAHAARRIADAYKVATAAERSAERMPEGATQARTMERAAAFRRMMDDALIDLLRAAADAGADVDFHPISEPDACSAPVR